MILDCTLRDGGYYNNWNFSDSLVNKYLTAIGSAKVDIVEIGFRLLSATQSLGPYAYSADTFLNKLPLPSNLQIAVMINAQDYIESNLGVVAAIETVFRPKDESPVDIVRIATRIDNIDNCEVIARRLHKLGYLVFINLMQVDKVESHILKKIVNKVESWGIIKVFYFADSFGSMNVSSIGNVIDSIKSEWSGEIGIHAHDNKGHALINTLSALDLGVEYLDATILGMGRGAGNTKIENLLVELKDRGMEDYNPDSLFSLSLTEFSSLQDKYKWGSNIFYYLSAAHGIHPTYVQEMLGDDRYDTDQILSAINLLKEKVSSSYSIENLLEAIADSSGSERGSWSAKGWAKGRDVLIIGSGPSTITYISGIKKYIVQNDPIVLCLNINQNVPETLVTAFVACHEARIAIECDLYSNLTKPIILPMARLPIETKELFSNINILDYGLKIQDSNASATDWGCILDKPLVLMYALSLLSVSGANKIFLTGIDGYEDDDPKQQEMKMALNQYLSSNNNIKLCAITPTSYPVQQQLLSSTKRNTVLTRFEQMKALLDKSKYFKLVCGAGNEDAEEVKRLTVLYTLAGAKGMDISANVDVVKACVEGIDLAFDLAIKKDIELKIRPFIMVSVGMPGDHHVRKSFINLDTCLKCDLCIPVCPTDAIPNELVVIKDKCIGCGNCSAICPRPDIIHYEHYERELRELLPKCLDAGAEQIELHAAVAEDESIMKEWQMISEINPGNHISMCLDRLHLSNFAFENRVEKAKEIARDRLIIQSDGYPMSGGEDNYNTTLQAIATADVLNKKFNMKLRKRTNTLIYKKEIEVNQLLSGGTNSLTANLANQSGVRFQGASLGTFARQVVKEVVENEDFYNNQELIDKGILIAKKLVVANIGEFDEQSFC